MPCALLPLESSTKTASRLAMLATVRRRSDIARPGSSCRACSRVWSGSNRAMRNTAVRMKKAHAAAQPIAGP